MATSKFLLLANFFIFSLNYVLCEESINITLINRKTLKAANICEGDNLFQCNAECDSIMFCDGPGEPILTQKCHASTPYCESSEKSAVCQTTSGTNCKPTASADFECTGEGYYPGNMCGIFKTCDFCFIFQTKKISSTVQNTICAVVLVTSLCLFNVQLDLCIRVKMFCANVGSRVSRSLVPQHGLW